MKSNALYNLDLHLNVCSLIESVHLVEKFEKDSLNFAIGSSLCVKTFGGNCVDLVDKDDGRTVLLCKSENVANLKLSKTGYINVCSIFIIINFWTLL